MHLYSILGNQIATTYKINFKYHARSHIEVVSINRQHLVASMYIHSVCYIEYDHKLKGISHGNFYICIVLHQVFVIVVYVWQILRDYN